MTTKGHVRLSSQHDATAQNHASPRQTVLCESHHVTSGFLATTKVFNLGREQYVIRIRTAEVMKYDATSCSGLDFMLIIFRQTCTAWCCCIIAVPCHDYLQSCHVA